MIYEISSVEELKPILKIGDKVCVHFESKRFDRIYQATGKILRLDQGLVGFDVNVKTNYPPGMDSDQGINQFRIRKVEVFD